MKPKQKPKQKKIKSNDCALSLNLSTLQSHDFNLKDKNIV